MSSDRDGTRIPASSGLAALAFLKKLEKDQGKILSPSLSGTKEGDFVLRWVEQSLHVEISLELLTVIVCEPSAYHNERGIYEYTLKDGDCIPSDALARVGPIVKIR